MKKFIIITLLILAILVVSFSVYLQPNDLAVCADTPGETTPCEKVDAVVAVSGGDTAARTSEAITLYKRGWADMIIFAGAAQDKSGPSNAAAMQQIALAEGVPESAILIDELSETTRQNAENTYGLIQQEGFSTIIVVTSGYHQRRAGMEFRKNTENVTIYNHPVAKDKDWSMWWWLTPKGWYLSVSEVVKIAVLSLGGGR